MSEPTPSELEIIYNVGRAAGNLEAGHRFFKILERHATEIAGDKEKEDLLEQILIEMNSET